jgi:hypothetical protein
VERKKETTSDMSGGQKKKIGKIVFLGNITIDAVEILPWRN